MSAAFRVVTISGAILCVLRGPRVTTCGQVTGCDRSWLSRGSGLTIFCAIRVARRVPTGRRTRPHGESNARA